MDKQDGDCNEEMDLHKLPKKGRGSGKANWAQVNINPPRFDNGVKCG